MGITSIIIPSYNGSAVLENQLPGLIQFLKEKNIRFEVIVVNDGSKDNGRTETIAKSFGCTYVGYEKNHGKGAAVTKGMQAAKGAYRIFTDMDIPFEYEAIEQIIYYMKVKEYDLVIGDRTLPESTYFSEIPKLRKMGSSIFTFIIGRFITTGLFDTQCGLKGFTEKTANDLFSVNRIKGFAFDVELLYISLKRNYDIKRIPVKLRNQEGSSIRMLKHAIEMIRDLLYIKLNHISGKYSQHQGQ